MSEVIRAPAQARSRVTMNRVYRSLGELLKAKSFDRITMAELATHADAAIGSIYARFQDKNAVLIGLHAHIADDAMKCLIENTEPATWAGMENEEMVFQILRRIVRFYTRHSHVLRATVLADVPQLYSTNVTVWQVAIERLVTLLADRFPRADQNSLEKDVRLAVRIVTAVMHQSFILRDVSVLRGRTSEKDLSEQLSRVCLSLFLSAGPKA